MNALAYKWGKFCMSKSAFELKNEIDVTFMNSFYKEPRTIFSVLYFIMLLSKIFILVIKNILKLFSNNFQYLNSF